MWDALFSLMVFPPPAAQPSRPPTDSWASIEAAAKGCQRLPSLAARRRCAADVRQRFRKFLDGTYRNLCQPYYSFVRCDGRRAALWSYGHRCPDGEGQCVGLVSVRVAPDRCLTVQNLSYSASPRRLCFPEGTVGHGLVEATSFLCSKGNQNKGGQ